MRKYMYLPVVGGREIHVCDSENEKKMGRNGCN